MLKQEIVIMGGARTPFGKFGGSLKDLSATQLAIIAGREALKRAEVKPEEIDHVIFGNVLQTSPDAAYLSRHVGLRCGVPVPGASLWSSIDCAARASRPSSTAPWRFYWARPTRCWWAEPNR